MSIRILASFQHSHVHEVRDDLESAIWVLVYTIIKYARNTLSPGDRGYLLDQLEYRPGYPAQPKRAWLKTAKTNGATELGLDNTSPLGALMDDLLMAAAINNELYENPAMQLEDHTWILSRLDKALEDTTWVTRSDKGAKNETHSAMTRPTP